MVRHLQLRLIFCDLIKISFFCKNSFICQLSLSFLYVTTEALHKRFCKTVALMVLNVKYKRTKIRIGKILLRKFFRLPKAFNFTQRLYFFFFSFTALI